MRRPRISDYVPDKVQEVCGRLSFVARKRGYCVGLFGKVVILFLGVITFDGAFAQGEDENIKIRFLEEAPAKLAEYRE